MMANKTKIAIWSTVLLTLLLIVIVQTLRIGELFWIFPLKEETENEPKLLSTEVSTQEGDQLRIYVLGNKEKHVDNPLNRQFEESLKLAKLDFTYIESVKEIIPSPYTILVTIDEVEIKEDAPHIEHFVNEGGRLFIGVRFNDPSLNNVVGIEESFGYQPDAVYGYHFKKSFIPLFEDIKDEEGKILNSTLDVVLEDDTDVYVTDGNDSTPLLWYHSYGKGKVAYWNATMLQGKTARGLLLQSLSLLPPKFVSSRLEMSVFFIDDFPAPFPEGEHENITPYYGLDVSSFYKKVWWPDMKELQGKYHLKYTAAFIGTYRADQGLTAKELIENNRSKFLFYGREMLQSGDEISLHGYNHQSLVTKDEPIDPTYGYVPWKDQKSMEKVTSIVMDVHEYLFPNYTVKTYVPPSNVINQTGLQALKTSAPSIDTISAIYFGDENTGAYKQEFGFDTNHLYFNLPRTSSGYNPDLYERFAYADVLANAGIFSHFIHPDDLLDTYRNKGQKWEGLKRGLNQNLEKIYEAYPFLEGMTAKEAKQRFLSYNDSTVNVNYMGNSIIITGDRLVSPTVVLVRLNEGEKLQTGSFGDYEVAKAGDIEGLYTVKTTVGKTVLQIEGGN
jgi:hypothetical protein